MDLWLDGQVNIANSKNSVQSLNESDAEDDFFNSIIAKTVAAPTLKLQNAVQNQSINNSDASISRNKKLNKNDSVSSFEFEPLSETDDEVPDGVAQGITQNLEAVSQQSLASANASSTLLEKVHAEKKQILKKLAASEENSRQLKVLLDTEKAISAEKELGDKERREMAHRDELDSALRAANQRHQLELSELKRHYTIEISNSIKQTLQQAQQSSSREIERLLRDLDAANSKVSELEASASNSSVNGRLAALEQELEHAKKQLADKNGLVQDLKQTVRALEKSVAVLERENESSARDHVRLGTVLEQASAEKEAIRNELDNERAVLFAERDIWKQERYEMQQRLEEDRRRTSHFEETYKRQLEDLGSKQEEFESNSKTALAALAAEKALLTQQKREVQERLEKLNEDAVATSTERTSLELAQVELAAEKRKLQEQRASLEQRLKQTTKNYTEAAQQASTLQIEVNQLQQAAHIAQQAQRSIEAEWEAIEKTRERLVKERIELHQLRSYLEEIKSNLWKQQEGKLSTAANAFLGEIQKKPPAKAEAGNQTVSELPSQDFKWLENFSAEKLEEELAQLKAAAEPVRGPRAQSVDLNLERQYQELEVELIGQRMEEYIHELAQDRETLNFQYDYLSRKLNKV